MENCAHEISTIFHGLLLHRTDKKRALQLVYTHTQFLSLHVWPLKAGRQHEMCDLGNKMLHGSYFTWMPVCHVHFLSKQLLGRLAYAQSSKASYWFQLQLDKFLRSECGLCTPLHKSVMKHRPAAMNACLMLHASLLLSSVASHWAFLPQLLEMMYLKAWATEEYNFQKKLFFFYG